MSHPSWEKQHCNCLAHARQTDEDGAHICDECGNKWWEEADRG